MAARTDLTTEKFGTPLYGAAFLSETLLAVGGGGGHGLKNKLVVAKFENGVLSSDPVFQLETGEEVVQRMILHPEGSTLVTAFSNKLQLYSVHLPIDGAAEEKKDGEAKEAKESEPILSPTTPKANAASLAEAKETKCLAFSRDGSRLAVGGGDGGLLLLSWPELKIIAHVKKAHKDSVTDADFSADGSSLITTGNEAASPEGGAVVWDAKTGARVCVLSGWGVSGKGAVRVRGVKFAQGVAKEQFANTAFVGANVNGAGKIFVFRKQPDGDASAWSCVGSRKALPQPITTLAMAPGGKTLGFGCSEGGVAALSSGALSLLNRLPYAHMVFVTALAFSPSGKVLASVSADASARCTAMLLNYLFWVTVLKLRPDVGDALREAQERGWAQLQASRAGGGGGGGKKK